MWCSARRIRSRAVPGRSGWISWCPLHTSTKLFSIWCGLASLSPTPRPWRSFFSTADILSDLVRASRDGTEIDGSRRDSVLGDLAALAGENGDTGEEEADTVDFQPMALSLDLPALDLDAALDTVPGR